MRIGELSRRSGVSPRSLRYYEQHGLLHAERSGNNYREYAESAVARATGIQLLLRSGVDRDLARAVMNCSGPATTAAVHRATTSQLEQARSQVSAQVVELQRLHRDLTRIIDRIDSGPSRA